MIRELETCADLAASTADAGGVYQHAGNDAGRHGYQSGRWVVCSGEPCYVFTTPQVWLDNQVMSIGELTFVVLRWTSDAGAGHSASHVYELLRAILQAAIASPESLQTMACGIAEQNPRRRWPLNAQTDYDLRDIEQATLDLSVSSGPERN